ncbi:MAG: TIGR04086 family membrane protein [Lachnospiraceae bacterium]|nr:TIGR04086 family membrane protein [Lachnospiraceae bacterium]
MPANRTGGDNPVPVFFLLKCLLFSYILTAALLLLLAFLLYKLGLSEGIVSIAISAIYVIATFMAGFIAGKKLQTRKFLWGMLLGAAYFVVLAVISLLVNQSVGELGNSFLTTLTLCAAGGTLGGMLG